MSTTPENPQDPQGGFPPPPPPGSTPPPAVPSPPTPPHGPAPSPGTTGGPGAPGGPGSGQGAPPPQGQGGHSQAGYGQGGYGQGGQRQGGYGQAAPGAYPPPAYGTGAPLSPSDQRTWAVLAHALTLVVGFIAPLVVWLVFKERGAFSEDHSKESLNFQITMTLAGIALAILTGLTFGLGALLFFPLGVFVVVFVIIAAVKAGQGQPYRYPLTYRFIK